MVSNPRYSYLTNNEDPADFEYLESFYKEVSCRIIDHYYRAAITGYENIPESGPVILASNHSGNAFPHDSFVLDQLLWRAGGFGEKAKIKPLYSPKLAVNWWLRPYGLDNWWRLFGAIDQTYINFDRVLARNGRVIYYPEGIPGIGKGFNRRYQLQPYQPSFVKLAARYDVPVVPVYGINAEWINPANLTFRWIDAIGQRLFGIPFVPIPMALLAIIFPFLFYTGFPCNMKFLIGKPVSIRDWIRSRGAADAHDPDRATSEKTAEEIRQMMQAELDILQKKEGQKPYHFSSLFQSLRKIRGYRWLTTPFGWPILFTRHYRDYFDRKENRNIRNRWLRDWDLVGYYLPFGWIFLALFRKFRKPPYGNRGLSKKEKAHKEGGFIWSLTRENENG